MAKDVFDLLVRVQNEKMNITLREGYHPADLNAFTYGVVSGIELGIRSLQAGVKAVDDQLLGVLCDWKLDLPEVLKRANMYLPKEHVFEANMFSHLSYRQSRSSRYYSQGIALGFEYVFLILQAYAHEAVEVKDSRRLSEYHLRMIQTTLQRTF